VFRGAAILLESMVSGKGIFRELAGASIGLLSHLSSAFLFLPKTGCLTFAVLRREAEAIIADFPHGRAMT